ncbi:hypothetical protein JX265_003158 [Neoarthrinium moseri]|uniref:Myb-like domain-containing protein n=1 Tax=Neoarthrinium moseri TaxID=1658444 RepID=A0A9Q0AT15_9PEZI|nr:uncharacterized protein JN550_005606 [Neoarthrinium moseri]KAI1852669.1 hypothetical protein JX266_002210 [Neoarthrinium moseri]KAI1870016.1 hypothetical protein JN550_005606 [Neoarthrinium moseri]KAI1878981.1 hypothetical protein JX265_003158 [Neoarthrinium moseri]
MNKNWNDRADKDLFFTILSIKNVGVISGSEWATIGNHMRGLGYGFTNEGCRQHFQGLRRAQNKGEIPNGSTTTSSSDNPRKADPSMNPITRRPGPGRGRPRKQPPAPVAQPGQDPSLNASFPLQDQQQLPPAPSHDDLVSAGAPVPLTIPSQDPSTLGLMHAETDLEEQPAKRQRLDEHQRLDDPSDALVDDAELSLDADGHVDAMVHPDLPEYFGEA